MTERPLAEWLLRLEAIHPSEIELGLDRAAAVALPPTHANPRALPRRQFTQLNETTLLHPGLHSFEDGGASEPKGTSMNSLQCDCNCRKRRMRMMRTLDTETLCNFATSSAFSP